MPRVHFVKAARKSYPSAGIRKGEPYYWWKHKLQRGGLLRRSQTKPKPSQLTLSEFMSPLLAAGEAFETSVNAATTMDDLQSAVDDYKNELESLKDETQEKFDNMPEGFQQGDTGQLLEGRVSSLEELIDALDGVDIPSDEDAQADSEEGAEDAEDADTTKSDKVGEVASELLGLGYEGE